MKCFADFYAVPAMQIDMNSRCISGLKMKCLDSVMQISDRLF